MLSLLSASCAESFPSAHVLSLLSASCAESAVFASDLTSYDERLAHRLRDDPETMMPQVSLPTACCIQRDRAMLLTGNCMH